MGRKLRSMFKPVTARPGTGERPAQPISSPAMLDGIAAGTVQEAGPPAGGGQERAAAAQEAKGGFTQDQVAQLAYERWLETGGSSVENWLWAEQELARRCEADRPI
jgi:hypothetical protein